MPPGTYRKLDLRDCRRNHATREWLTQPRRKKTSESPLGFYLFVARERYALRSAAGGRPRMPPLTMTPADPLTERDDLGRRVLILDGVMVAGVGFGAARPLNNRSSMSASLQELPNLESP